jgi:hypothetical protein
MMASCTMLAEDTLNAENEEQTWSWAKDHGQTVNPHLIGQEDNTFPGMRSAAKVRTPDDGSKAVLSQATQRPDMST